jgi:hypothetical protein
MKTAWKTLAVLLAASLCAHAQQSAPEDTERLQRDTQNPVSNLISVPYQNNTNFPIGSFSRTQNVLNIQPVIPLGIRQRHSPGHAGLSKVATALPACIAVSEKQVTA